jgi:hypothetical protein
MIHEVHHASVANNERGNAQVQVIQKVPVLALTAYSSADKKKHSLEYTKTSQMR